ncbi:hypothetical protein [Sphingomonas sp. LHG3406-1]|uniref:hypothetical protein n=1 Tax=Sphingomonas sp. LHG3406-1 TaxID=2804617 RepID=UPI0026336881|nr:hypothetical protein [Sphingomonas sp. LHG3406-1]
MSKIERLGLLGAAVSLLAAATPAMAQPKVQNDDTPEEIAKDAARDLKDNRFYNKPGATRAQYDADWQECRLIARGSKLANGSATYYNPALYNPSISPLAAGVGGGIGAAIAAAIAEGQARRDNRKRCLMIRGWRMVKLPADKAAQVAAMTDEAKQSYFNTIVGAQDVQGEIEKIDRFTPLEDPALKVAPGLASPATLWIHKDPKKAVMPVLAPNQGAIVVAYNRNHPAAKDRFARIELYRYDAAKSDLHYQPRDWKKKGDLTTYVVSIPAGDRRAGYELRIIPVTAGDYVLGGATLGTNMPPASSNCFGAPMISVKAGEYAYLADATPVMGATLSDGSRTSTMVYTRNLAQAQAELARLRPELAGKLVEAPIVNRATYSCAAVTMDRFDWPGAAEIAAVPAATAEGGR